MSSTLLTIAGVLYLGVGFGFVRNGLYFEGGAWFCYSVANWCFAARAYLQGN